MGNAQCRAACEISGNFCAGLCHLGEADGDKWHPRGYQRALAWFGVGQPGFVFPELTSGEHGVSALQAKPSLAICVSGGGFRATCCALGWVRGLWSLGVVQQARYLCSNSGGSWFNTSFSYQDCVSVEEFLGPDLPPEGLTLEEAYDLEDGSYAMAVTNANHIMGQIVRVSCKELCYGTLRQKLNPWERAIGNAFLAPFGLASPRSTFALAGDAKERAARCGAKQVHTACQDDDMPYPIEVGCMMLDEDPCIYRSYEITPQYVGVPTVLHETPQLRVGGVLVESFAACSSPPVEWSPQRADCSREVELRVPWSASLAEMTGISSQYLAQNFSVDNSIEEEDDEDCDGELSVDQMNTLSSDMEFSWLFHWNAAGEGDAVQMGDGGGTDNMAVLPAVRRGVRKLICCAAVCGPPDEDWAASNWDISGLFGMTPEGSGPKVRRGTLSAALWNKHVQVFDPGAWYSLLAQVRQRHRLGLPLIARVRSPVLPNVAQGVAGGYIVDMLWFFNGCAGPWLDRLPEETRECLAARVPWFPYLSTKILDYGPVAVSCLSGLASWCVAQSRDDIARFLQEP